MSFARRANGRNGLSNFAVSAITGESQTSSGWLLTAGESADGRELLLTDGQHAVRATLSTRALRALPRRTSLLGRRVRLSSARVTTTETAPFKLDVDGVEVESNTRRARRPPPRSLVDVSHSPAVRHVLDEYRASPTTDGSETTESVDDAEHVRLLPAITLAAMACSSLPRAKRRRARAPTEEVLDAGDARFGVSRSGKIPRKSGQMSHVSAWRAGRTLEGTGEERVLECGDGYDIIRKKRVSVRVTSGGNSGKLSALRARRCVRASNAQESKHVPIAEMQRFEVVSRAKIRDPLKCETTTIAIGKRGREGNTTPLEGAGIAQAAKCERFLDKSAGIVQVTKCETAAAVHACIEKVQKSEVESLCTVRPFAGVGVSPALVFNTTVTAVIATPKVTAGSTSGEGKAKSKARKRRSRRLSCSNDTVKREVFALASCVGAEE